MNRFSLLVSALSLGSAVCAVATADSIELKRSVRIESDATHVLLRHVAALEGPEAIRLAETVIAAAPAGDSVVELSVDDVHSALETAGVQWAKVDLSGTNVIVRPRREAGVEAPQSMAGASIVDEKGAVRGRSPRGKTVPAGLDAAVQVDSVAVFMKEETLRGLVVRTIVNGMSIEPDRLHLAFDEKDAKKLERSLAGVRFEIEPASSWRSDRVEVTIRRWDGPAVVETMNFGMKSLVKMERSRVRQAVSRDAVLRESDVEAYSEWLPPSQAGASMPAVTGSVVTGSVMNGSVVVGQRAGRDLAAGETIRDRDLHGEPVIHKGDRVKVRKVVGACVITLDAEAMTNAAKGEGVELARLGLNGRRDRKTFMATVSGMGEAVLMDPPRDGAIPVENPAP